MFGETPAGAVDHNDASAAASLGGPHATGEPTPLIIGGVDVEDAMFVAKRKMQNFLDKIAFYPGRRWCGFTFGLIFFLTRMYIQQGYAVIAYLLGLFYLNNIMLFLAPAEDPEEIEFNNAKNGHEGGGFLPTRENDEYKGFQRKMHEMDFWTEMMSATVMAAFCSCFQCTDIEIYWPLLLFYFIFMTAFLCRYKLEHMIRYRYIPFEMGKKSYSKNRPEFATSHYN